MLDKAPAVTMTAASFTQPAFERGEGALLPHKLDERSPQNGWEVNPGPVLREEGQDPAEYCEQDKG